MLYWTLNGTYLGPYKQLRDRDKDLLIEGYVGETCGVHIFRQEHMPSGTLELWDDTKRLAVVEGGRWNP